MSSSYTPADELPDFTGSYLSDECYLLTAEIGKGSFARVYKAHDMSSTRRYAVKCMARYEEGSSNDLAQQKEIEVHRYLSSRTKFVVRLHEVIYEGEFVFLILDYCDGGDLWHAISEEHLYHLDEGAIFNVFNQILDAVEECHQLGVYHRDLKPTNVLVSRDGQNVFLSDFGLSTRDDVSSEFGVGTCAWMSPEVLNDEGAYIPYSSSANDVWSLGVILINLVTCRLPFPFASSLCKNYSSFLSDPNHLRTFLPISLELNDLCRELFHPLRSKRLTSISQLREKISTLPIFFMSPKEVLASGQNDVILNYDALLRPHLRSTPCLDIHSYNMSTSHSEEVFTPSTFPAIVSLEDDDVPPLPDEECQVVTKKPRVTLHLPYIHVPRVHVNVRVMGLGKAFKQPHLPVLYWQRRIAY